MRLLFDISVFGLSLCLRFMGKQSSDFAVCFAVCEDYLFAGLFICLDIDHLVVCLFVLIRFMYVICL